MPLLALKISDVLVLWSSLHNWSLSAHPQGNGELRIFSLVALRCVDLISKVLIPKPQELEVSYHKFAFCGLCSAPLQVSKGEILHVHCKFSYADDKSCWKTAEEFIAKSQSAVTCSCLAEWTWIVQEMIS